MKKEGEKNDVNRRKFIKDGIRYTLTIGIGGVGIFLAGRSSEEELVWQLDPEKCVQCGRCATNCVRSPSAVKCMHVYDMCGYCDLCSGYFRVDTKNLTTAAENQLCPTSAIERIFIEEPYFEYHIDEDLCIGCGKCVEGCEAFGNGSLQLQVNHNLCLNCNQCSIARDCPADAFSRVPASSPYNFKGFNADELI
ncbi:MAG: 4Fe-4S binding protein [Bacteroidales bacterium]|nr:4Fe-4S binding protein [Bacteroidales bacterium]